MTATRVRAIRGATCLEANTSEQLDERIGELVGEILHRNEVDNDDLISVLITATADISAAFPALSVRKAGLDDVPLLGAVESDVDGGKPLCVRLMVHVHSTRTRGEIQHVYLRGAASLRPDLSDQ